MRRPILWACASLFIASGATWLVAMIWRQSALDLAPLHAPPLVAALITGATLARVLDRRRHAIALATGATLAWTTIQLAAFLVHDAAPRWSAPIDSASHYALVAALAVPAAAATASLRLVGRPDHRLLWLWISALLMLGTIVAPLTIITQDQTIPVLGVIPILGGPILAGAITQILKPYRAIWTSGGGALIFALIMIDKTWRQGTDDDFLAPLLGMGIIILLGALGARIGWRLFRHSDPRMPPIARVTLPTATTSG